MQAVTRNLGFSVPQRLCRPSTTHEGSVRSNTVNTFGNETIGLKAIVYPESISTLLRPREKRNSTSNRRRDARPPSPQIPDPCPPNRQCFDQTI